MNNMKIETYISGRYLFAKRKLNFITIISIISVIGVTLGVAAMIVVLSVFNGFNTKVTSILVGFDPHIRIESSDRTNVFDYNKIKTELDKLGLDKYSEYTLNKGMISSRERNRVIYIKGVKEDKIKDVSGLMDALKYGEFDFTEQGDNGSIILGLTLADQLRCEPGDTLTLLSPVGLERSLTQFVEPQTKSFIVKGIFDSENKDYDLRYAYITIENAQQLFKMANSSFGVEIRLKNINDSENIQNVLKEKLGSGYSIMTWYDLHKDFYSILKIERWVAFIILSLIILVATFNILGSLTMTVIDKKRDIGILKTLGANDNVITKIFLYQGIAIGLIGMIAGSALGLITTLSQKYFHIYKLDSTVYKIQALPVELRWTDFIFVSLAALILCMIASLYPSKKAAKTNPVKSIRWE